jgi:hypothetical protein
MDSKKNLTKCRDIFSGVPQREKIARKKGMEKEEGKRKEGRLKLTH